MYFPPWNHFWLVRPGASETNPTKPPPPDGRPHPEAIDPGDELPAFPHAAVATRRRRSGHPEPGAELSVRRERRSTGSGYRGTPGGHLDRRLATLQQLVQLHDRRASETRLERVPRYQQSRRRRCTDYQTTPHQSDSVHAVFAGRESACLWCQPSADLSGPRRLTRLHQAFDGRGQPARAWTGECGRGRIMFMKRQPVKVVFVSPSCCLDLAEYSCCGQGIGSLGHHGRKFALG
jgi:hypothetical protein